MEGISLVDAKHESSVPGFTLTEGTVPHGPLASSASYNSYIAFLLRLCYNP